MLRSLHLLVVLAELSLRRAEDIRHCLFWQLFPVSVRHPLYFSWLNNAQWRHSCICAAFVILNVLIASCSGSLSARPRHLHFPFWITGGTKLCNLLLQLNQVKQSWRQAERSSDKARLTSLGPEASQTQCKACGRFLPVQYWAAGLQEPKMLLKQ